MTLDEFINNLTCLSEKGSGSCPVRFFSQNQGNFLDFEELQIPYFTDDVKIILE